MTSGTSPTGTCIRVLLSRAALLLEGAKPHGLGSEEAIYPYSTRGGSNRHVIPRTTEGPYHHCSSREPYRTTIGLLLTVYNLSPQVLPLFRCHPLWPLKFTEFLLCSRVGYGRMENGFTTRYREGCNATPVDPL